MSWVNDTEYKFENLEPYTQYNITVYVRNLKNMDVYPPVMFHRCETRQGIPSEPRHVRVQQKNKYDVLISWDAPLYPRGIINGYQINVVSKYDDRQYMTNDNETSEILSFSHKNNWTYTFTVSTTK